MQIRLCLCVTLWFEKVLSDIIGFAFFDTVDFDDCKMLG